MSHMLLSICLLLRVTQAYICRQIRALLKKRQASKYSAKVSAKSQRREHQQENQLPEDELADVFK